MNRPTKSQIIAVLRDGIRTVTSSRQERVRKNFRWVWRVIDKEALHEIACLKTAIDIVKRRERSCSIEPSPNLSRAAGATSQGDIPLLLISSYVSCALDSAFALTWGECQETECKQDHYRLSIGWWLWSIHFYV